MCACEPGFTCSRCRGVTMDDDHELEFGDEPETVMEAELRQQARAELEQKGIRA